MGRGLISSVSFTKAAVVLAGLGLSACVGGSPVDGLKVDKAQGSYENIGSLTQVVNANPRDPEAYNVRGSAYGRAGKFSAALKDFTTAISLNRRFYQAYSNRALMYKNIGNKQTGGGGL